MSDITAARVTRHVDDAMVKIIARAFRWREMLENGEYSTIREIAAVEKINESYVGRVSGSHCWRQTSSGRFWRAAAGAIAVRESDCGGSHWNGDSSER